MDRNVRLLGFGAAIRMMGVALYTPFFALFLVNVLHLAYVGAGIIISAVGVTLLPFSLLGGLITDRLGRRPVLLLGLAGEAAATFGLAYAFLELSLLGAIAASLAGGIASTLTGPATSAYVADFARGSARTRGYTFYRIGYNAGYSAGVSIGGLLIVSIGFAGAVTVAATVIASGTVFLALTLAPSPRDLELRHAQAAATSGETLTPSSHRPSMRASFRQLARDRVALELLLAFAFAVLVTGQWGVTFPLYIHNVLGVSYWLLGIGLALNGLIVVLGQSPITESMIGRRHTSIAVLGLGVYAIAFLGLGTAGLVQFSPGVVFFVAVAILTIGENLITIPRATLPSNLAPPGEVGAYNGAFAMTVGIGSILAVLLGGAVLSLTSNPLLVWVFLVIPALPAMILIRRVRHHLSLSKDQA